jgi:hypothetical protein
LRMTQLSLMRNIQIETFQFMAMLDEIETPSSDECKMGLPSFRPVLHGIRFIEVLGVKLLDFEEPYIIAENCTAWHKQR